MYLTCPHCQKENFYYLAFAGSHVKATCGQCDKYIKFVKSSLFPTLKKVRGKIWELGNKDAFLINILINNTPNFKQQGTEAEVYICHWNLMMKMKHTNVMILASNKQSATKSVVIIKKDRNTIAKEPEPIGKQYEDAGLPF